MRTLFYHFIIVGTFIYGTIVHYWYLLLNKGEKRYRYVCKVGKNWGKNLIWASGSQVKTLYKNGSEEEINKIRETGEAVILISNHQSNVDIPTLLGYLPLEFSFIAKKEMKKWPMIGRWMRSFDCIFLDRKNVRQGMKDMKEAISKIKNGHSYVIFPEGSRSKDGTIEEFKKGSFKLATDTGAKIVPITLVGTYEVQNRKSLKITPNKDIKIIVDKPLDLKELSKEEQKEVHEIVNKIIKNNFEEYKNR
ncbi:lysophospholipid acyltransferase family protein [Pseudoleptotrichia goodfellowii]|uniref:1-acyl-sn-glycerol-3-phosphate acyltransferase n=1 Tax=Pseudoleptotrichia goodfellowii F0264 TaxID=596323 RepID=D0GLV6_9FUSO|nr:lysophospholipid acyltransferase family protein [Pseudoleptotrichia goodfellowii]EEY34878.1 Acyltransferase [Pseudoleptotrichia goodfellowii F0264]